MKWYIARSALTGLHWEGRNARRGLRLAKDCIRNEAVELIDEVYFSTSLTKRGEKEALEAFLNDFDFHVEEIYNGYVFVDVIGDCSLIRCVIGGCYREPVIEENAINVGLRAAVAKDAAIVCTLGRWYFEHRSDVSKALPLFKQAAEWGDRVAQYYYGSLGYSPDNFMRYVWWKKALERRLYGEGELTKTFFGQIIQYLSKEGITDDILFEMGGALKIHFDNIKSIATNREGIVAVQEAISFYNGCYDKAQEAIQYWLVAGNQFLVKNVTVLIGQILQSQMSAWGTAVRGRTVTHEAKKARRYGQKE